MGQTAAVFYRMVNERLAAFEASRRRPAPLVGGDGLAGATIATYERLTRQWQRWAGVRGVSALPASPDDVAEWVGVLAAAGRNRSGVRLRLAAVGWSHRQAGFDDPTQTRLVRAALARVSGERASCSATRLRSLGDAALLAVGRRRRAGRGFETTATHRRRVRRDRLAVGLAGALGLSAASLARLRWCDVPATRDGWALFDAWLVDLVARERALAGGDRELVLGVGRSQTARLLRRAADDAAVLAASQTTSDVAPCS